MGVVSVLLAALFTCALSPNPAPFSFPLESHGVCRPGLSHACGCGSAPACLRSLRGGTPELHENTSSAASGQVTGGKDALDALRRDAAALRLMEEKMGCGKPRTREYASRAASSVAATTTRSPAAKASSAAPSSPTKPKEALDSLPPYLPQVQPPAAPPPSALNAPAPAVRPKISPPPPVVSVPRATIKIPRTAAGRGGGSWVERLGRFYSETVRRTVRFCARASGLIQVRKFSFRGPRRELCFLEFTRESGTPAPISLSMHSLSRSLSPSLSLALYSSKKKE